MRNLALLCLAASTILAVVLTATEAPAHAAGGEMVATASSPLVRPGGEVAYELRLSSPSGFSGETVELSATLPPGFSYETGSTLVDGEPAADPQMSGTTLRWSDLPLPAGRHVRYGVHTFIQDIMDAPHTNSQLRWSRALSGPGGYVKQLFYPVTVSTAGPQQSWIDFIAVAYARDLIPVVRLQGSYDPRAGRWNKPEMDPDGSYARVAEAFKRVVAGLPRRQGFPLYVEVWNEPNIDADWGGAANPAEYARFLLDVGRALRSLGDPHLVILNAGLAPGGNYFHLDFIDAMFQAVPGAAYAFDVWASHPYAGNRPPEFNADYFSIQGYRWELARLARYRAVSGMRVIATEAGYALGNRDDPRYPPVDESNRATYTRDAFELYWSQDERLVAAMPFQLSDPFGGWAAFDWVYPSAATTEDGHPTNYHAVYESVRSLPKPLPAVSISFRMTAPAVEGTYRPTFQASAGLSTFDARGEAVTVTELAEAGVISGQVVLQSRPISSSARVFVGTYTALVAADGSFQLAVPPGSYTVTAMAEGHLSARREQVPVEVNARTTLPAVRLTAGNVIREPEESGQPERVDTRDLEAVANAFNGAPPVDLSADLNGDGTVNVFDLVAVAANLGRSEPEPWP